MPKVTKRLRYEILRRDGFRCRYCGATPAEAELRVDHVVPEALGGPSVPSNLATACHPCNSGKSSVLPEAPIVEQVADDALRWSAAMELAASEMEARLRERDDQNLVFLNEWTAYTYGGSAQQVFPLDPNWSTSVTRLRTAGLTDPLIVEAVNATLGANRVLPENRFRYFCGVAWNMITQLQESAEKIASAPSDSDRFNDFSRQDLIDAITGLQFAAGKMFDLIPHGMRTAAEDKALIAFGLAGSTVPADRIEWLPIMLLNLGYNLCESPASAPEGDPWKADA